MAVVMMGNEIREIRRILGEHGIVCHVHSDINNVRLELEWNKHWVGGKNSGLDVAWFVIRSVVDGAVITYLNGHEDDLGNCFASVLVNC